jgi:hypothetical protein
MIGVDVWQRTSLVPAADDEPPGGVVQQRVLPAPTVAPQASTNEIVLQDTNYPPPANALFVAPTGDNDHPGTRAKPYRTLTHAVDAAPDGATIVLREGVYREGDIQITGKPIIVQPFPHEQVWFKGSNMLDTWQPDANIWRTTNWKPAPAYKPPANSIDPKYLLAQHPDQVFVDGEALQQVASKDAVVPGTFFINYERSQLFIGDNPQGKTVEASAVAQAITIEDAPGTMIRGLGFLHYATPPQHGALEADSPGVTFERNTAALNAGAGFSVSGADNVVRDNISLRNGQLGLHGARADRLVLEGNRLAFNNQKRFNMRWEAGGAKVSNSKDTVWRNNVVEGNAGNGLWCDITCYNTTIVHNLLRANERAGLSYEISARAVIASNVFVDNEFGVNINESSEVEIYNNTLVENGANLRIYEGKRTNADPTTRARIPWNVSGIVVENNIIADGRDTSRALVVIDDFSGTLPQKEAAAMVQSLNNNAYYRRNSSTRATLVTLSTATDDLGVPNLDALRHHGYEANGLAVDDVAEHPFFVNAADGDYRLQEDSPVRRAGTPLPPAVAAALGVQPNEPVDLGALPATTQLAAQHTHP